MLVSRSSPVSQQRLGDAEVDDEHLVVGEDDVLRLDVAVHDALRGARRGARSATARAMRTASSIGQLRLAREPCAQRLARDERHRVPRQRDVAAGGEDARVEHGDDSRMLESRREPDLANEPVDADRAGQVGVEHLDRDGAIMTPIVREPDGRHAAAPELTLDHVPVGELRFQPLAHRTSWCRWPGPTSRVQELQHLTVGRKGRPLRRWTGGRRLRIVATAPWSIRAGA